MPLKEGAGKDTWKSNMHEFFHGHNFKKGMSKKKKIKQSIAVAYAMQRKAKKKKK